MLVNCIWRLRCRVFARHRTFQSKHLNLVKANIIENIVFSRIYLLFSVVSLREAVLEGNTRSYFGKSSNKHNRVYFM